MPVDLGVAQDRREYRQRAVGRGRRRVQGSEPALHVSARDISDSTAAEPRQDLIAEIRSIDRQGPRLPDARVVAKGRLGHGLEQGIVGTGRRDAGASVNGSGGHVCFSRIFSGRPRVTRTVDGGVDGARRYPCSRMYP